MKNEFILAIDLGGTNLKIALGNSRFKILHKKIIGTHLFKRKEKLIAGIADAVKVILREEGLARSSVLGLGLGLPGPINAKSGVVHFLPNIPGWHDVPLKRILERKLKLSVAIDNDAKLMCLAEHRLGAARSLSNAVCITLGTGVGGGLIIGGKLYRGSDNASGEIGHLPINEGGALCGCGSRGCLESYIGNRTVLSQAKKKLKNIHSLKELSELALRGNKQALSVWKDFGYHLGSALVGVVNILNPDGIVIGGGVAGASKIFLPAAKDVLRQKAMSVQLKRVKILKAKLGNDAGLIGAMVLVKEGI